jgi:hypothetical protein
MLHRKKFLCKFAVYFFLFLFCFIFQGLYKAEADDFIIDKYDPNICFNGTTLFADVADGSRQRIVIVNRQGDVVWKCDLAAAFSDKKQAYLKAYPHNPEVMANGNVLVAITGINMTTPACYLPLRIA